MGTVRRQFWQGIEVIHDVVYFGDDIRERFDAIGLKGWWMSYFAARSAALGTPGPKLVTALFHGFSPQLVARALPDAWSLLGAAILAASTLYIARREMTLSPEKPPITTAGEPEVAPAVVAEKADEDAQQRREAAD